MLVFQALGVPVVQSVHSVDVPLRAPSTPVTVTTTGASRGGTRGAGLLGGVGVTGLVGVCTVAHWIGSDVVESGRTTCRVRGCVTASCSERMTTCNKTYSMCKVHCKSICQSQAGGKSGLGTGTVLGLNSYRSIDLHLHERVEQMHASLLMQTSFTLCIYIAVCA